MRLRRYGLRRDDDFTRLWAVETVSAVGSQITPLALPLVAVVTLHATAGQMGLLAAAERLPFLAFGLAAGVWIDRRRRWPPVVLLTVPLAALAGALRTHLLYGVAFLAGTLTPLFDVAYVADLPSLVRRDHLIAGNSRLQASAAAARAAGPELGGLPVGLLTAPVAIACDAAGYLVSAAFLLRIRTTGTDAWPRCIRACGRGRSAPDDGRDR